MKRIIYSLIWGDILVGALFGQTLNLDCTGGKVRATGTSTTFYAHVYSGRDPDPFPRGDLWAVSAIGAERKFDLTLVWSGASGTYYVGLRPGNIVKSCTASASQPSPSTPPPVVTPPPTTPPPPQTSTSWAPGTGLQLVEVPGQTTRIQVDSTVVLFVGSRTSEPCRRSSLAEDPATGQLYYCTAARKWRKLVME